MIASELAGEGGEGFWTIASADGRRQLELLAYPIFLPYALSGQQTLGLTRAKNPAENRSIREIFAFLERGGKGNFCQGLRLKNIGSTLRNIFELSIFNEFLFTGWIEV